MKRAIQITLFILFSAGVLGLMGFVYLENGKQIISDVVIRIEREHEKGFISGDKIKAALENHDSILSRQVNQIQPEMIAAKVKRNIYVEEADVYLNMEKNLVVNIREKQPILRVYSKKGEGFYIDTRRQLLPLNPNYSPRVLVANGYINYQFDKQNPYIHDTVSNQSQLIDLFDLTSIIMENKFLHAQISQVYVNSVGEYDLIPEVGNHLIQLGSMQDAQEKLEKLEVWYKKSFVNEDWGKYNVINLKYKDQVVCTKK